MMDSSDSDVPMPEDSASATKKRKLSPSGGDIAEGSAMAQRAAIMANRDDTFYFEDGSCVLLIESTLFNVHRSILSKDNSTFEGMFALPQGGSNSEGSSDENPIILSGDTATAFKNFLWALYALPYELARMSKPHLTEITKLLDIIHISNKYAFKSTESWALDVIQDYLVFRASHITLEGFRCSEHPTCKDQILDSSESENIALLDRLARIASRCRRSRILSSTATILRQNWGASPRYAYCAMVLGDDLNLSRLKGDAYYTVMQLPVVVTKRRQSSNSYGATLKEGELDADGRLVINVAQQFRLLSGYRKLSEMWMEIQAGGPDFAHNCVTSQPDLCAGRWKQVWDNSFRDSNVASIDPGRLLGRLKVVQGTFERGYSDRFTPYGSYGYHSSACTATAKQVVGDFIKSIEKKLSEVYSVELDD